MNTKLIAREEYIQDRVHDLEERILELEDKVKNLEEQKNRQILLKGGY